MNARSIRATVSALVLVSGLLAAATPSHAFVEAAAPALPVIPPPAAGSTVLSPALGLIGIVAALGLYDILRRTTCMGDVLGLGGPGFDWPIGPNENVLPPVACAIAPRP